MSGLLVGLLSAALSTNPPVAISNLMTEKTGLSLQSVNTNDPVETACFKILLDDAAAQNDVLKWTEAARLSSGAAAGDPKLALDARIRRRLDGVKAEYEAFILQHPNHIRIRLAYGNFLYENDDDEGAIAQCEKACELDPKNPSAWNDLANYYSDLGPAKKAFESYDKAIALDGRSIYYRSLAERIYQFRREAGEYYHLNEQQVIDKVLELYRKAIATDPDNFALRTDYAELFYTIAPPRWQDGLAAWNAALNIARDDVEREGIYVHLARLNINLGQYEAAQRNLNQVTNSASALLKNRLVKRINDVINKSASKTPLD